MTGPDLPAQTDKLVRSVQIEEARDRRWDKQAEPAVVGRLAQIGVLGWMVVTPMLVGVFAGRWLDGHFQARLFYTAPLLMLGAALGAWSAWRWMQRA